MSAKQYLCYNNCRIQGDCFFSMFIIALLMYCVCVFCAWSLLYNVVTSVISGFSINSKSVAMLRLCSLSVVWLCMFCVPSSRNRGFCMRSVVVVCPCYIHLFCRYDL